jgi:ABC-type bacteriocin/lantibiotic exporter with double-glycine peptidase domain
MLSYFKKIIYLYDNNKNTKILFIFFILNSIFDFFSIGLIGPIIAAQTIKVTSESSTYLQIISNLINTHPLIFYISILCLFIFKYAFSIFVLNLTYKNALNNRVRLQHDLLEHYLTMPYDKFLNKNISDFTYFIQNIVPDYTNTLVNFLKFISDTLLVIVIIILLGLTNILLLIVILISFSAIIILYDKVIKKRLSKFSETNIDSGTKIIKLTNETLNGKKEINIYGINNYFLGHFKNETIRNSFVTRKILIIGILPRYVFELLFVILVILFLAWIYLTNQNPLNSITTFGTFAFAAIRLLPSINSILNSISQLRYFQNSVNQLYDQVVDSKNSNNSIDKNLIKEKSDFNTLKFDSLSFKYPTQKNYILNNVNLEILKGDKICILGDSGSGKSTLIDIITSFLKPNRGIISYNDNIEYNFEDIRDKIAYIPQNIVLLDDTIKNNIALGVEENMIDINKIYESISKAKLQDFIENKELGINDIIGDKGMRISGGQRQRIALARAFYFDKEFLILDEATSALDEKTESEILDTLFEDKNSQTTIIIISHRHHVQNYCNKVFKLYKGDLKQIK